MAASILALLHNDNPWWLTGTVPINYNHCRRFEFQDILEHLDSRRILALTGPAHIGKTTLMLQTISHLLKLGVPSANILYLNGSHPLLFENGRKLKDILDLYASEVLCEPLKESRRKVYVFVDNITLLTEWHSLLNDFYKEKYPVKFIISSAHYSHIFYSGNGMDIPEPVRNLIDSIRPHLDILQIYPLSLRQFMYFYSKHNDDRHTSNFLSLLPKYPFWENMEQYTREIEHKKTLIEKELPYIQKVARLYFSSGGYPGFFAYDTLSDWQGYLREDVLIHGLYRDIIMIYPIKNPEFLERLVYYIAYNNGGTFAYRRLAEYFGIDTMTLTSYLSYLTESGLITLQEHFTSDSQKVIRKNKKISIADCGLLQAILAKNTIEPEDWDRLIASYTLAEARRYSDYQHYPLTYRAEGHCQVPLVIQKDKQIIHMYTDTTEQPGGNRKNILLNNPHCQNIVITKNEFSFSDGILFIPFYLL